MGGWGLLGACGVRGLCGTEQTTRAMPARVAAVSDSPFETNPTSERLRVRLRSLAGGEDKGGARLTSVPADDSLPGGAEAEQMRVRVIALENLVIALLAAATERQQAVAFDMGDFISPRPGCTPHPMTLRAAEAMRSLLERADRFRTGRQA